MRIEFQDIHKYYGRVRANAGISLVLEPGRIYGLLGENGAGKTTLMRMLAGHTQPSRGRILFDGESVGRLSPSRALGMGVGMLYQDPQDFPALTVWENFRLGGRRRDKRNAIQRLQELGDRFHFRLPPEERATELTVGERQQLDLLRLLDLGANVLILDEPTTGISVTQKETLFAAMNQLAKDQGRTIIFVTHKLAEAEELCQEILVLRQGRLAGQLLPPFRSDELVDLMFGSESGAGGEAGPKLQPNKNPFLSLEHAQLVGEKYALSNASLSIRPGEIVGLAGLEGNGQELLLRSLAGLTRVAKGRIIMGGEQLQGLPYVRFRQAGIHFFPAARLEEGLFPDLSLVEHFQLAFPTARGNPVERLSEEGIRRFRIHAQPFASARTLSGGNQQRLLLALIPKQIKLLLLEHPTRGLDQGAGKLVWHHLAERCRQDTSLIFSSADLEEIKTHSHRILVFYNRRLVADRPSQSISVEEMGRLMAGQATAA
ncbi:MAG: ATP-binding cassette domain-containing protein [Deltaproteobacteria bacterium]|nr:MAG: ATP-binding cassette domain-containing protein [Deltaproteobacteria bacterium]